MHRENLDHAPAIMPDRLCKLLAAITGVFMVVQVSFFYVAEHPYHKGFVDCLLGRCSEEMLNEQFFLLCGMVFLLSSVVGWFGWDRTGRRVWGWLQVKDEAQDDRAELLDGIRQGREAFRERFGVNSKLFDAEMLEIMENNAEWTEWQRENDAKALMRAGFLEGMRQVREGRKESGVTGDEFDEATVFNIVGRYCRMANEYADIPDSLELEARWEALCDLLLAPLYSQSYPDQSAIVQAHKTWREVLDSLHELTANPKFAYLVGALEVGSQAFLLQICVRGGNTANLPLREAWLSLLKALRSFPVEGAVKIPSQAFFKETN